MRGTGRYYEYRHSVEFEEIGLDGNVFGVNYVRWQGRCFEMFLLEHAPSVLGELGRGLDLITLAAECQPTAPVRAGDELSIRMWQESLSGDRVTLSFSYVLLSGGAGCAAGRGRLAAEGRRVVACVRDGGGAGVPGDLRLALAGFVAGAGGVRCGLAAAWGRA
jgi:enediyne biosynthesis thioesterase